MADGTERTDPPSPSDGIRPTWSRSGRPLARRLVKPLQAFLEAESSSAALLLGMAAVALVWANSPWRESYDALWHTRVTLGVGEWAPLEADLRHWVNDGLMSLFFLVVGLEIKRELLTGELRDRRAAAVTVVAAIGGMALPALIYLLLNVGGEGAKGWGIPMATDIAFALGVLTLAARNAPASVKPFLLTLAIVDDIGAILVIAVVYASGVSLAALAVAAAIVVLIVVLQRLDVRATSVYVGLGVALWVTLFGSGVHPTLAGVILGFLTPSEPFQRPRAVSDEAVRIAEATVDEPVPPDVDAPQWLRLAALSKETVSPLARAEAALHPWTSYLIIPIFALANAGVELSGQAIREAATSRITLGVLLGLVVGKILGITLASFGAIRLGLGRLPAGCGWREMFGLAAVAGIGFTVSLFITELAFVDAALVGQAKVGILVASLVAGVVAYLIFGSSGGRIRPEAPPDGA